MNPGAILIGVAASVLLGVYIAQPFRRRVGDLDALIEAWTAQQTAESGAPTASQGASAAAEQVAEGQVAESQVAHESPEVVEMSSPRAATSAADTSTSGDVTDVQAGNVNFCHRCGRPVKPHHRFCPNCGANLIED